MHIILQYWNNNPQILFWCCFT